ncbi:MAG: hypothetical protein ACXU8A_01545 [Burkholderiaceae bacterium]
MDSTLDLNIPCPVQSTAVKSVRAIIEALYQGTDLNVIRDAIADLMEQQLQRGHLANNDAALPFFINGLGSLTINVNSKSRSSPDGLYTCLVDLENAIATLDGKASKRPNLYTKSVEQLSYTFLIEALVAIRQLPTFQNNH